MRRFSLFLITVFLVLALGACSGNEKTTEKPFVGQGVPSVVEGPKTARPDWRALEKMMEEDPASVVPPSALKLVGGADEYRATFPKGFQVKVKDSSWAPDGAGGVVHVVIHYPDGTEVENVAILLEDIEQRWWILQTLSLEDAERLAEEQLPSVASPSTS